MPARPSDDAIRAFVALELDAMSVRRLLRVEEHLRGASGAPSATYATAANLHLTLKFMAELTPEAAGQLGPRLGALTAGRSGPSTSDLRLEAFPSADCAEVIVVALGDPEGALAGLARETEAVAALFGIPLEARAFKPHVTIARLKRAYDARRWLGPAVPIQVGECRAVRLTLFRSEPTTSGPSYVPLARHEFA
jgi:2'-5' RNA ligase